MPSIENIAYNALTYADSLKELVRNSETSVRLSNCMVSDPELGAMTIGEYLKDIGASYLKSLKTQNMGRKTADELKQLVERFVLYHIEAGNNRLADNLPSEEAKSQ
jgi:hypothetical protein